MKRKRMFGGKRMYILLAAVLLLVILILFFAVSGQDPGYVRTSEYLTMADGTRLAYDLFLPATDGVPADGPLPALLKYTPYNRTWTMYDEDGNCLVCDVPNMPGWYVFAMPLKKVISGNRMHTVSRSAWIGDMLESGYAVIAVDRPGTGASFGRPPARNDLDSIVDELDEILYWIADQPWCDGNIGMFGDSIQARIQFLAAATGNPHLKAILPATTWIDNYSAVMFPGGVLNTSFVNTYAGIQKVFAQVETPVDGDEDRALLAQAVADRGDMSALGKGMLALVEYPFRDAMMPDGQNAWIGDHTLYPLLESINQSSVPVYLINGWYDIYARDNFVTYANLSAPKRLLVRPTDHSSIEAPGSDVDYAAEALRWFDYWLKGIDNGIMAEPPIQYYLQGAEEMQSSDLWPLEEQEMTRYYFGPGEDSGKASVNDGTLDLSPPTDSQAFDAYKVDYSTTTGTTPHWTGLGFGHKYPEMSSHDAKCLTYTTPPVGAATNIIGHPIMHLWLNSEAPDLDVFVYLEEVDGKKSTYITQGILRASHRTPSLAPFENFGLPWFNHFESELQPIPAGEPFEMVLDLFPTAYQFSEGNQIRITIAFADAGNFDTPVLDPVPTLKLLRNPDYPTYVELPVVP